MFAESDYFCTIFVNSLTSATRVLCSEKDRVTVHLAESVDQTIRDLLGETVPDAFFIFLETKGVSKAKIPDHLDSFCSIMEQTFGLASAGTIRRAIAKRLYSKLDVPFVYIENGKLVDYVRQARRRLSD